MHRGLIKDKVFEEKAENYHCPTMYHKATIRLTIQHP